MSDKEVEEYIDGVAVHWYWDSLFPPSLLDRTHNNFPDKFILATEASVGKLKGGTYTHTSDFSISLSLENVKLCCECGETPNAHTGLGSTLYCETALRAIVLPSRLMGSFITAKASSGQEGQID
jgi:hypothetical protein